MVENRPFLAFYEDKGGTSRIFSLKRNKPEDAVHVGRVSETITLWTKNITGNELINVKITVTDKEVEISPFSIQRMMKDEMVEITFIWRPKLGRRTALQTKINSFATEIIRPR